MNRFNAACVATALLLAPLATLRATEPVPLVSVTETGAFLTSAAWSADLAPAPRLIRGELIIHREAAAWESQQVQEPFILPNPNDPARLAAIDYAHISQRERWVHHPVVGDPSWDSFHRIPGNPVYRGSPPYEWPVNGFFFEDPASGNWYLFIGHYQKNYAIQVDGPPLICTIKRSRDHGKTWDDLGPIFPKEGIRFDGVSFPAAHAPDVCVIYADGKYHMAFDWCTSNTTWENAFDPKGGADGSDGGAGYAVSDSPEGPWRPCPRPFFLNSQLWQKPILGKYRRFYGTSLLRRQDDWLILVLTDSAQFHSWGLVAATAKDPAGPWSALQPLLHTEDDRYHPALGEFFPAFVHDGFAYAPATSVAGNRNYQAVYRAPLQKAHEAAAWELWQDGAVWHAEDVEHEYHGIWGQTFAGGVRDGMLRVMFPSRDANGMGTINLAERSWDQPYREQGFVVSAHDVPQVPLLREGYGAFTLAATLRPRGDVSLLWAHRAPLGPEAVRSGSGPSRRALAGCRRLRFAAGRWEILDLARDAKGTCVASGPLPAGKELAAGLEHQEDGTLTLSFNGKVQWVGKLPLEAGTIGFWLEPRSHAEVRSLTVRGEPRPHRTIYLGADALLPAGQRGWTDPGKPVGPDWDEVTAPSFRCGFGCRSKADGVRAKWNFMGDGFALWSPKGPELGEVEVRCDGRSLGVIALRAELPERSSPILEKTSLAPGRHTVVLRAVRGVLVVDCLEALTSP